MGKVEELFAAGAAAYRAGEPRDETQPFDWKCGWDSAEAGKKTAFMEYRKVRSLHERDFSSSAWSQSELEMVRASRTRRIAKFEEEFPDFKGYYEELKR